MNGKTTWTYRGAQQLCPLIPLWACVYADINFVSSAQYITVWCLWLFRFLEVQDIIAELRDQLKSEEQQRQRVELKLVFRRLQKNAQNLIYIKLCFAISFSRLRENSSTTLTSFSDRENGVYHLAATRNKPPIDVVTWPDVGCRRRGSSTRNGWTSWSLVSASATR